MATESKAIAPLWLELKTDYIDVNFDRLVNYLESHPNRNDEFYIKTIDLLQKRTTVYLEELTKESFSLMDSSDGLSQERKERLDFGLRLLGIYLLTANNVDDGYKRSFAFQQLILAQLCSETFQNKLSQNALDTILCESVVSLGYEWHNLFTDGIISYDIITKLIIDNSKLRSPEIDVWYEGKGCAFINNGKLSLVNYGKNEISNKNVKDSISIVDNKINVKALESNKLKQSKQDDVDEVMKFTNDYIDNLKQIVRMEKQLKEYAVDKETMVEVRITEKKTYDEVWATTISNDYKPLKGKVVLTNALRYYSTKDCYTCLNVGDVIGVRITKIDNSGIADFDMTDEFVDFIVNGDEYIKVDAYVVGRSASIQNGNTRWLTNVGVPVYVHGQEFSQNTMAKLKIVQINTNGYIYARYIEDTDETFFENDAKRNCMQRFCFDEGPEPKVDSAMEKSILATDLSIAARAIYLIQKSMELPRERYRMLCVVAIICKMIGDEASFQMVDFVTTYIRYTIYFATGNYDKISEIKLGNLIGDDLKTDKRITIINILRNYDGIKNADFLDDIIQNKDENLARLAKLVQANNHLGDFLDKQILNSIKREITKMLSVDEETKGLENENGVYLGTEDINKEFKTSFVFPPENKMQAAPSVQRTNVFKSVCGFLNSITGGTLYIGVNDLGYVVGIQNDMNYLKKDKIDEYIRYIQDEAKKVFGLDILTYITISSLYDGKVVALQVKPCDYKIVTLDGVAYIRINSETRKMDEETKIHTLSRKNYNDKDAGRIKYDLSTAIENECKVILHGYSSSHGGDLRDRNVEPFAFTKGQKHVWCYDLDDNKNKLFSTSRISNVEILDEKWAHKGEHKELNVDVFNMIGSNPIHIILQLDMMSKNLLVEEFSMARNDLYQIDDEHWHLDTEVYSLEGIGRFYLGLAEHIQIIDGEELKKYARDYVGRIQW